jgi:hypothetical protein
VRKKTPSPEMQALNNLVDRVLSVPKVEMQRRQAEYLETVRNNPNRRGPKRKVRPSSSHAPDVSS